MKMKKVLPLFMAAVIMTAGIPMAAGASEPADGTAAETQTDVGTEDGTGAADGAGPTDSTAAAGSAMEGENPESENPALEPAEDAGEEPADEAEDETEDEEKPTEVLEGDQVDTDNVVTLGENLSEEQRKAMYEYFGTSAEKVRTIIVTHADEVKYMEGIATAEQIGATTNSCA